MGDLRTFKDRFARGAAPDARGFAPAAAEPGARTGGDAFARPAKPANPAKPAKPDRIARPAKGSAAPPSAKPSAPGSIRSDAFAPRATPVQPGPKAAPERRDMFGRKQAAPKAASRMVKPAPAPKPKPVAPMTKPANPPRHKSLMVKPTPVSAPAPKSPMVMLTPSPPPARKTGSFFNPFERPRAKPPSPLPPEPHFDPPPAAEPSEVKRASLHVVAGSQLNGPVMAGSGEVQRPRSPVRSSSLVLVSGAGATAVAEADVAEAQPSVVEAPPEPVAPAPSAPSAAETPKPGGGGGAGGGSGGNDNPPVRPGPRQGFNQDDIFGAIFGVAVIAFLLLWVLRGRGDESSQDGTLFAAQSAPAESNAPPTPLALVDPFGNAPVDLRPSGPIPEPLPEPEAPPQDADIALPAAVPPPPVAAAPAPAPETAVAESSLPLAERKMHAWFCTASSRLTTASRGALTSELETFSDVFKNSELVVRGHADTRGSTAYNSALSGERARVVADFLRTKGLVVSEYTGAGELAGLDDNQDCPNQRRVDVWVKGGPAEAPSRACAPNADAEALVCN